MKILPILHDRMSMLREDVKQQSRVRRNKRTGSGLSQLQIIRYPYGLTCVRILLYLNFLIQVFVQFFPDFLVQPSLLDRWFQEPR
jgi:hypothetical protein